MAINKVVLVTGGAGYIGSHACKALFAKSYTPVVIDNLVYGHKEAVKWGPLEVGDISDRQFLDGIIKKYTPIAVMHFAAFAYVGESVENPQKYYKNNVSGTINLLDLCLENNIKHFIFSSTCATYGVPSELPINEEQLQQPVNPYGASKLMIERVLKDYSLAYGLNHVSLRYFNAAGADIEAQIGENHQPETHLIPLILDVAIGKRDSISIFGNDYDTSDGTCVRDYIHVSDLASAHVKALDYLLSGGKSIQANLGTGIGFSVQQVIDCAEQITGKKITRIIKARRVGDPPELVAASMLSRCILSWEPLTSTLPEIISSAWEWHKKIKN